MSLSEWYIWRPNGRLVISSFFLLVVFSSCGRKSSDSSYKRISKKTKNSLAILKEAKHSDLPVPIGYKFIQMYEDSETYNRESDFLCYLGNLSVNNVIDYYCKNMERYGWEISNFSTDGEGLLFCNKLNKDCIISIRKNMDICKRYDKKNCICLFIKDKNFKKHKVFDINSKKIPTLYVAS